jgi:5-methylcytosine-specific restriction endonuclease McrA
MLERKSKHSIKSVLSLVPEYDGIIKKRKINFKGDMLYIDSMRYFVFRKDNCTCTSCGMKASFFAKEKHLRDKSYHLNLYGYNDDGEEVLFTKDHHIPVSKGGSDDISNLNTMCFVCNKEKGNSMPE